MAKGAGLASDGGWALRGALALFALLLAALLPDPGLAQQGRAAPRVALVVGVAAYKAVPALANPANDAADMGAALDRLGFQTEVLIDPDRAALEQAVRRFGGRARGADAALFFYAGHAIEAAGRNWLLPRTADIASDRDLRFEALDADSVLEQVEGAARMTIVLLDSCRDNPFRARMAAGTRGGGGAGLAPVNAATGTLIAFSTAPGTVAEDGRGRNSPFTGALLKHIEEQAVELRQVLAEVRRDVREATGGRQVPWEHSSLEGAFYFKPAPATPPPMAAVLAAPPRPAPAAGDPEMLFWDSIRASRDPADFRAYLARFPQGIFAALARNRLGQLGGSPPPGPSPTAPPAASPAAPPGAPLGSARVTPPGGLPAAAAASAAAAPAAAAPIDPTALRAKLVAALSRRLARGTDLPANRAEAIAIYASAPGSKAMAVEPHSGALYRRTRRATPAEAEQVALEGCAIYYGKPCALLALDDALRAPDPRRAPLREMPRLRLTGAFAPENVPMTSANFMPSVVASYPARAAPKALVLSASPPAFFARGGATTAEAEAAALADCAATPTESGGVQRCRVYALDDRVVLPEGRPRAAPAQASRPSRPQPAAASSLRPQGVTPR